MLMDWTEPIPSPQSGSSQPKLVKLLAFLVAISKEANLVHVILATSDYYLASWLKGSKCLNLYIWYGSIYIYGTAAYIYAAVPSK